MTPRPFEIPGIRSWRPGGARRRAATNGHGASPVPVTPELRALLEDYARQRDETARKAQEARERRARFEAESRRLLDTVLLPSLERVGAEVERFGHTWSVEPRLDIDGQPAVACEFRRDGGAGRSGRASELAFRFQFPDRLAVTGALAREEGIADLPARCLTLDSLDAAAVEREVTRFLTAILAPG